MALRASKYRNATSNVYRTEFQYPNLSLSTQSGDGAVVAGNMWWIALAWHSNVGGAIAVLPSDQPGRRDVNPPLIQAHSGQINDMAWNPFHEWVLASGGSDGLAKVWKLPEAGLTSDPIEPIAVLSGHGKRVDSLAWHPTAINILATAGTDNTVKVWDITSPSSPKLTVSIFADNVDSIAWNYNGSLLAAVSRDKKLRVFDPRTGSILAEADSHQGAGKPQRVTWLGQHKLFTTGFSKTRDREFMFWDSRSMTKPLKSQTLDAAPGALTPMFDFDTNLLFLAARGDSTVRVMEVVEDAPYYYEMPPVFDKMPQRGVCLLPKRACHVMGAEVAKLYRALNNSVVPIGFRVPRKHYMEFWEELYPETAGPEPALTAAEYLAGDDKEPLKVSLRPSADGSAPQSSAPSSSTPEPTSSASGVSTPDVGRSASPAFGSSNPSSASGSRSGSISAGGPRNFFDSASSKEETVEYYTPKEVKVVRSTKYRHIIGKAAMKIHQYDNLRVLSEAAQNRAIAGNQNWIAVSWQGVAGRIGIFDVAKDKGKCPAELGLLETGSPVLDFAFNPFKTSQLATAGENALVKIWDIPSTGIRSLKKNFTTPTAELRGHQHKVVALDFHPTVENLLLTASGDLTAKLWDISTQQDRLTLKGFEDLFISSSWNFAGNRLATTSKDRVLRIWDARQQTAVHSGPDIGGMLGTKVAWYGKDDNKVILVGFDKNSERTIQLVDLKKIGEPLATLRIDNSSSVLTPVFDPDTGVLLLWGKGDTSVKFFEVNNEGPMIHALTDHQTSVPQVGIAYLHKTTVNAKEVEIARVYKLTQTIIEPITFSVPRTKKELFQDDIYTPTLSAEPSNDAQSWFNGTDKTPIEISLQPAGMMKLSDEPKKVIEKRRVVVQDDSYMDLDKVKSRMLGSLGALANIEDQPIPGDEKEGVDESEWDD